MWSKVAEVAEVRICEKLGDGGNGIVYRASSAVGVVAAKTLFTLLEPEMYGLEGESLILEEEAFCDEAKAQMKFSHPNIINTFGVWFLEQESRKIPYIISELGEHSFDKFLLSTEISKLVAIQYAMQILEGLEYLHDNSIAHRDVKPANMVLVKQENEYVLKLIDFGNCKASDMYTTVVGTSAYKDPQVDKGLYDKSVDIYSFGCVLIQMLCSFQILCKWKFKWLKKQREGMHPKLRRMLGDFADLVDACTREENRGNFDTLSDCLQKLHERESQSLQVSQQVQEIVIEEDNAIYCFNQAIAYYFVEGVEQDRKKAVEYFTLAANKGLADAQYFLATCYEKGEGVDVDMRKAVEWYSAAADQGFSKAQNNLGCFYRYGKVVEVDLKRAVHLFSLAAADPRNSHAQNNLATCYHHGHGVEPNLRKAVDLYQSSASLGHPQGMYNLALCYQYALERPRDFDLAIEWLTKASNLGNEEAHVALAYFYNTGLGGIYDPERAVKLYQLAASNPDAQIGLAIAYQSGQGVEKDAKKAAELFQAAADKGAPNAQYELGYCYQKGKGVKKDLQKAHELFALSANQGNPRAKKKLKRLEEKGCCVM